MRIKRSSLMYSASILLASNLVLQILNFVYRIFLVRLVGAEGLGVYSLVMPVFTVVISVSLAGVTMAVTSMSSQLAARGSRNSAGTLVGYAVKLFLSIFTVAAIPVVLWPEQIAEHILGEPRTSNALLIVLICIFLTGFENIHKSLFIGLGKVKYTAISETTEFIFRTICVLALLWFWGSDDYEWTAVLIFAGMTASELISVALLRFFYRSESLGSAQRGGDRPLLNRMVKISIPVSLAALLNNVLFSANTIMLPNRLEAAGMSNDQAVAALGVVSGMALPLLMLPGILVGSVSTVLMPRISAAHALGNRADIVRKSFKGFQFVGLTALPLTAVLIPLAPTLSKLCFNHTISLDLSFMIGLACVLSYYQMICNSILVGLGNERTAVTIMLSSEALRLAGTYFLVPILGINGYVAGMVASSVLELGAAIIAIKSITKMKLAITELLTIPVLTALALGLFTRFFFICLLGEDFGEVSALLLSASAILPIYLFILTIHGLNPIRYLQRIKE